MLPSLRCHIHLPRPKCHFHSFYAAIFMLPPISWYFYAATFFTTIFILRSLFCPLYCHVYIVYYNHLHAANSRLPFRKLKYHIYAAISMLPPLLPFLTCHICTFIFLLPWSCCVTFLLSYRNVLLPSLVSSLFVFAAISMLPFLCCSIYVVSHVFFYWCLNSGMFHHHLYANCF